MRWIVKYGDEILGSVLAGSRMTDEEICDFAGVSLARSEDEYLNSPDNGFYILDDLDIFSE